MKKFNGKNNAYGEIIENYRIKNKLSRAGLSRKLDLIGIPLSYDEIYRIERHNLVLKDFELIAICMMLKIDYKELENIIIKNK